VIARQCGAVGIFERQKSAIPAGDFRRTMLYKVAVMLAVTSLAALALHLVSEPRDEAALEAEVAGQLDALREHLFGR